MKKWPFYTQSDKILVNKILSNGDVNYLSLKYGIKFENKFSKIANCKYAISVSNGTIALELALTSLNLKKSDEVIVTSRSFVATASSIVNVGFKPVFADIEYNSQNISHESIVKKISKKTKALLIVHLAGYPCDMKNIMKLVKQNKLFLIEDCSQAHGAEFNGKPVGSFGHVNTWSFCQDKIISTAGEGGMITTNNKKIFEYCSMKRNHGKKLNFKKNKLNKFQYIHDSFGSNYRLTEIQSAIGLNQINKLDSMLKKRHSNAKILEKIFLRNSDLFYTPIVPKNLKHAWYKFYVYISDSAIKKGFKRDVFLRLCKEKKIKCLTGSCPEIYLENCFKNTSSIPKKRLPVAKKLGDVSLMFDIDPSFSKPKMINIAKKIQEIINKFKKDNNYYE